MHLNKEEGKELISFIALAVIIIGGLYAICWISNIVGH
jgi:hypothetical protein